MTLKRKQSTYSFFISAGLCLSGFVSSPRAMETPDIKSSLSQINDLSPITSPKELWEYQQEVTKLYAEKSYEAALHKALAEPPITFSPISISDLEGYCYAKQWVIAEIYYHKAKKELLDPEKALEYLEIAQRTLNAYLNDWRAFKSQVPSFNDRMVLHKAIIYNLGYKVLYSQANLLMKPDMNDCQVTLNRETLKASIAYLEEAYHYSILCPSINTPEHLMNLRRMTLETCCSLYQFYSHEPEKEVYRLKANTIYKELKDNPQAKPYMSRIRNSMKFLRQLDERNRLLMTPKGSLKVEALKGKTSAKLTLSLMETAKELNHLPKKKLDHVEIIQAHENLRSMAQETPLDTRIIVSLKRIEQQLEEYLIKAGKPYTLSDIYNQYAVFIGEENLKKHFISLGLPCFLNEGRLEEALERLTILGDIEYKKQKNNSLLLRFLRAAIKNMQGDFEEWKSIEQELISLKEKEKEKKKNAKNRQRQRKVALIKEAQQLNEALKESSPEPTGQKKKVKSSSHLSQPLPSDSMRFEGPSSFLSTQELKQQKALRHAEAQKERERQEEVSRKPLNKTTTTTTTAAPFSFKTTNVEEKETLPLIKDLYLLKGVSKEVDEEIENNSWRFTRASCIVYFEALGCVAKEGAKHKKVSLPQALIFTHNDKVLTILNDLGGALTLPRWDGAEGNGQVPGYLRKQILKAREKLAFLKVKAGNLKK